MRLLIYSHILISFLLISRSICKGQDRFNTRDADILIEAAETTVERLGIYLNMIGDPNFSADEKEEMIKYTILQEIISGKNVLFSNDLDPTGSLPKNLDVETYLHNIKVGYFPPQEGGVKINFQSINAGGKIFKYRGKEQYFVKVVVRRSLEGKFSIENMRRDLNNSEILDFYLKVFENGERSDRIAIYSMDLHKDNTNKFIEVELTESQSSIFSKEELETFQRELYKAHRDVAQLNKEIDLLKRENELMKMGKQQIEIIARSTEESYQENKAQMIIKNQEIEGLKQERDKKTEELSTAKDQLSAKKDELGRIKRVNKNLIQKANKNRLSLILGVGGGLFLGDPYHQNFSQPQINSLYGTTGLWYRLSKLQESKNGRLKTNFALLVYGRYGNMNTWGVKGMVEIGQASSVNNGGRIWDFETGFLLWNHIRFSAGIGELSYQDQLGNIRTHRLYTGTVGLLTGEYQNRFRLATNFSIWTLNMPENINFWNYIPYHPSVNLFIEFKLQ